MKNDHSTIENTRAAVPMGKRIRELRGRWGLSLRACAARAGVAASFLSKVESCQASPTIPVLQKILEALGTDLGSFFTEERRHARHQVVWPRAAMRLVEDRDRRWFFAFPNRSDLGALMTCEEYRPRTRIAERERHQNDLLGLVLAGTLTLELPGQGIHRARQGDAFCLRRGLEHVARNEERTTLKMVVVSLRARTGGRAGRPAR